MSNWAQADIDAIHARMGRKPVKRNAIKAKRLIDAAVDMFSNGAARPQTRKKNPEYRIQADFVKLMNARHPEILVFSDTAAHIKKTMVQQQRANVLSSPREKWPDTFVAQPSGDYAGFWIEFKAGSPFKKDGVTLLKNDHIFKQAATMQRLRSKGYKCEFAWSAEMAFEMVEAYLNL